MAFDPFAQGLAVADEMKPKSFDPFAGGLAVEDAPKAKAGFDPFVSGLAVPDMPQAAPAPALATNAPAPAPAAQPPKGTSWLGRKLALPVVAGVDMAANAVETPLASASVAAAQRGTFQKPSLLDTVGLQRGPQGSGLGMAVRGVQAMMDTPEGRNPIVNAILRTMTPDIVAEQPQKVRQDMADAIRASVGKEARESFKYEAGKRIPDPWKDPLGWADATLSQTLINLPQMAGAIVASKIPYVGHVVGVKMMGDQEANSYAQAWRAAGVDEDFMAPYAQAYGLAAGLVEYSQQLLFYGMTKKGKGGMVLRPFAKKMQGVAAKIIKSPLGRALLGRFADAVSEGGEELSQGYLEYIISRKMAQEWNAQHPDRPVALPDWSGAEAWENFKAGASVGIAFGTVGGAKDIYKTVTDRSRYAAPIATATPEEIALGMPPDVAAEYRNAKTEEDKAKIVEWWNRKKMAAPPAPTTKPSILDIQPQEGVIPNAVRKQEGQEGQGPVAPATPETIEAVPAGTRGVTIPPVTLTTQPAGPPIVNKGFTQETQQAELDRLNRKMRAVYRQGGITVVAAEAPQDDAHAAAQAYVESRGRKVLWFRDSSGTVKAIGTIGLSPDVVVLNADSTTLGRDVVEEEIAHDFSRRKENKAFVSGVVTLMKATDPQGYAEFVKGIRTIREYSGMTQEAIDDEYFAKTFGYLMNNREFADKAASVDRSAFRRAIDFIKDIIDGIFGSKQRMGQIDQSRMTDMSRYFADMTQLHDAMLEVYRRTAKTAAEKAEAEGLQPAGVVRPYAGIGEPQVSFAKDSISYTDAALAAAPEPTTTATKKTVRAKPERPTSEIEDFFGLHRKLIPTADEHRILRDELKTLAKGSSPIAKRARRALAWFGSDADVEAVKEGRIALAPTSDNMAKWWVTRYAETTGNANEGESANQMQQLADAIMGYVEGRSESVEVEKESDEEEERALSMMLDEAETTYVQQRKQPPPEWLKHKTPRFQKYITKNYEKALARTGKSAEFPFAEERDGKRVEFFEDAAGWHWRMGGETKWRDVGTEINLRGQQRLVEAFTAFRDKKPEKYVAPKAEAVTEPDAIEPENAELPPESDELPFAAEANVTPEEDDIRLAVESPLDAVAYSQTPEADKPLEGYFERGMSKEQARFTTGPMGLDRFPPQFYKRISHEPMRQIVREFIGKYPDFRSAAAAAEKASPKELEPAAGDQVIFLYARALRIAAREYADNGDIQTAKDLMDESNKQRDAVMERKTLFGRSSENTKDIYDGFGDPLFQERFFVREVEKANAPVMAELGGDVTVEAAGKAADDAPKALADALEGKRKAEADAAQMKAERDFERTMREAIDRSLRAVEREMEERLAKAKVDAATYAEIQQQTEDEVATLDESDDAAMVEWLKANQPTTEAALAAIDEPIEGMNEKAANAFATIARKAIADGKQKGMTKGQILNEFQKRIEAKYKLSANSVGLSTVFDRVYAPTLDDIVKRAEARKQQRAQQIADKRKKTIRRRKQTDANQPMLPEGEEVDVGAMFDELREIASQRAAQREWTPEELAAYQRQIDEWLSRFGFQENLPERPAGTQPTEMERRREAMRQLELPQQAQDAIESLFAATEWSSVQAADLAAKLGPSVTETKPPTAEDLKRRRDAAIRRRGLLAVMLKEGKVRIAELLRMPAEQRAALGRTLADQINATLPNIRPGDAARIAVAVQTELTRLFNAEAKKRIDGMTASGKLKAETTRQKAYIRDVLQMVNMGIFDGNEAWKEKARDAFYKRYGLARMTPEIQAKLEEYAARIAKLPDGSTMQRDATQEAMRYMAAQIPYNWKDLTLPIIFSHLLSGFTTTAKNMLANFWSVSDIILLDSQRAAIQAVRERSFDPLRSYTESLNLMWRAFRISAAEAGHIMRTGYSPVKDTKFSDEFRRLSPLETMEAKTKVGKAALAIWRLPRRLMLLQDMLFWKAVEQQKQYLLTADLARRQGLSGKQLNDTVARIMGYTLSKQKREAYRAQARAEGNKGFVDVERRAWQLAEEASENDTTLPKWWRDNQTEVSADAVRAAQEATFNQRNEGTIGLLTHHLGQAAAKTPTLRPLFMFTTVIGNVVNRQIDYSPYALARIFRKGRHGGIKQQTGEVRQYSEYEDDTHRLRLLNGFFIAAMAAFIAWKAAKDYEDDPEKEKKRPKFQITGSGPSDPRVRKQIFDGKYAKRFSIRFGDLPAMSYENTPFAGILAVVGRWMDWYLYEKGTRPERDTMQQVAFLSQKAFAEYALQASPISYASTFLGALKENDANLSQRLMMYNVAGLTKYAIPNILLQADQMRDPSKYQAEEAYEYFLRNIPVARSVYGRPALNIFGQPIKYGRVSFITEKMSNDPVGLFLLSRKAWLPDPRLDAQMDIDDYGNRVKSNFTPEEKYEFSKVYGQTAYNQINREMAGMKYWTDDAVRSRISKICTVARKTAKNAIINMRQQAHFKSRQLTD